MASIESPQTTATTVSKTARVCSAKRLGGRLALLLQAFGEKRHEGGIERTLGKKPAEKIGQLEGDKKGIGHGSGPKHRRDQDIAHEAQHPAQTGVAPHSGQGTNQCHTRAFLDQTALE